MMSITRRKSDDSRQTPIMNTQPATDSIQAIQRLLKEAQPTVLQAWLFGSVAKGTATSASDLDIAIETSSPLDALFKMSLIQRLTEASGRPVDLIDLKTTGEPLLGEIIRHGKCLIGNKANYAELLRRHLFEMEDFQPYISQLLKLRRQAWIG